MYCLYFYTEQTVLGVRINLFSEPQQSHDKLDTPSSKKNSRRMDDWILNLQKNSRKTDDGRTTDSVLGVPASHSL